ncbi:MAG: hypothetical protein AAGC95_02820 [Pseudomonadota bacterium]
MLPEDERRLQRERDIYLATRGPDYSILEKEIRNNKSRYAKGAQVAAEARARERRPAPSGGTIPQGNPDAARREAYGKRKKEMELARARRKYSIAPSR